ncbi:RNA-binding protein 1-like [Pyrus communis]|uniref:RNA-binding protein 1-like n=1 Tax=Pyrus communis TaxID=23211 RepID=UPI0035C18862
MRDPYRIYFTPPQLDSVARPSFPGYLSSETPSLPFNPTIPSTDTQRSYASDFLHRDIRSMTTGAYAVDDAMGLRSCPEPVLGATERASTKGYSLLLEVPSLISKRLEVAAVSMSPNLPADISLEKPAGSSRNADVLPVKGESNVLFVDGLPTDSTRREVGHIFRPFIGFKEIKVIHKEPRRSGDKAMVLCFVELADAKCALTAMEALQGYKFDNKKPESPALKIHFAHFPFSLPGDGNEHRNGIPR